jgi:hypothetical protein
MSLARYHLRYTAGLKYLNCWNRWETVPEGFEPSTFRLSLGVASLALLTAERSNQLSYGTRRMVREVGFEPTRANTDDLKSPSLDHSDIHAL